MCFSKLEGIYPASVSQGCGSLDKVEKHTHAHTQYPYTWRFSSHFCSAVAQCKCSFPFLSSFHLNFSLLKLVIFFCSSPVQVLDEVRALWIWLLGMGALSCCNKKGPNTSCCHKVGGRILWNIIVCCGIKISLNWNDRACTFFSLLPLLRNVECVRCERPTGRSRQTSSGNIISFCFSMPCEDGISGICQKKKGGTHAEEKERGREESFTLFYEWRRMKASHGADWVD